MRSITLSVTSSKVSEKSTLELLWFLFETMKGDIVASALYGALRPYIGEQFSDEEKILRSTVEHTTKLT